MANDNNGDKTVYRGPDQRRETRRQTSDRRDSIRFEPDKDDRRKGPGRRKEDQENSLWRQRDS